MRILKFALKSFFAGFLGGLGALTVFVLAGLILSSVFKVSVTDGLSSLFSPPMSHDSQINPNSETGYPPSNADTTDQGNSGNIAPAPPMQPFMGTPVEAYLTFGNDPKAERASTISLDDLSKIYVWVKSEDPKSTDFNILLTLPDGSQTQFGPTFSTDPSGQPVNCGQFGNYDPPPGLYRMEVVPIGTNTSAGVVEFTITE